MLRNDRRNIIVSIVKSFAILGVDWYVVDVEVKEISGQPMMSIVGLGDTAVKEARERIQEAINDRILHSRKRKL